MADTSKAPLVWPPSSWAALRKIVRAWYTAGEGGKEITQKTIADIAGIQPSRLSMNKPFLQAVGIIEAESSDLTEEGKQFGLGLTNDNLIITQQALASIVRENAPLRQLFDVIRARGAMDKEAFEAQVIQITKQGKETDYFGTGVNVLREILVDSGLVQETEKGLRALTGEQKDVLDYRQRDAQNHGETNQQELRRIPIPVSAKSVWYVEVSQNPDEFELEKFIEMQKLIFSNPKP
jgi:hypothetical protein